MPPRSSSLEQSVIKFKSSPYRPRSEGPEKLLNLRYRLNPSGDVILIFSPHRPLPSPLLRPLVINQARFAEMRF